jgi:hypothetical protein
MNYFDLDRPIISWRMETLHKFRIGTDAIYMTICQNYNQCVRDRSLLQNIPVI